MKPIGDRWDLNGEVVPHTVPQQMPDRKEADETLVYGPRGEALVVRRPIPFGFQPPKGGTDK